MAFVSPLPPIDSGIADYSADLVPELMHHYDITLITDQDETELGGELSGIPVHRAERLETNGRTFDRILYHIGNSQFHQHMFRMMHRYPGVSVLHDFFVPMALNFGCPGSDLEHAVPEAVYHSHGHTAVCDVFNGDDISKIRSYPCNRWVLDNSLGIVVHSNHASDLRKYWYGGPQLDHWHVIPHLKRPPPAIDRKQVRRALGFGERDFIICTFGPVDPARHSERLLAAWLKSSLAATPHCHLVFVGRNMGYEDSSGFLQTMNSGAVTSRVKITGQVSRPVYSQYLSAADVAVQLHTASGGETSGAVLDCLSRGIPLIVNAHGSMGEYPEKIAIKLGDEFDEADLLHGLESVHQRVDLRQRLSLAGRRYVQERHEPEQIGRRYHCTIEQIYADANSAGRGDKIVSPTRKQAWSDLYHLRDQPRRVRCAQRQLLIDIGELAFYDHKKGIERVVRNLVIALIRKPPAGFRVEPVYRVDCRYHYARRFAQKVVHGVSTGCDDPATINRGDVFVCPDLNLVGHAGRFEAIIDYLKSRGVRTYFLIHDLLPISHEDFFPRGLTPVFEDWLRRVATHADGVVTVSSATAREFLNWLDRARPQRGHPLKVGSVHLGADMDPHSLHATNRSVDRQNIDRWASDPTFLMVGTVEPRKGHIQAIRAFQDLWSEGLNANLLVIGRRGWSDVSSRLDQCRRSDRFLWLDNADDDLLAYGYRKSSALLAVSHGEGFGLPLIEAARFGTPIIARDIPVFREVAGEHAYYFTGGDTTDLSAAIRAWLKLYRQGAAPSSRALPHLTWEECGKQLVDVIFGDQWSSHWPRMQTVSCGRIPCT